MYFNTYLAAAFLASLVVFLVIEVLNKTLNVLVNITKAISILQQSSRYTFLSMHMIRKIPSFASFVKNSNSLILILSNELHFFGFYVNSFSDDNNWLKPRFINLAISHILPQVVNGTDNESKRDTRFLL